MTAGKKDRSKGRRNEKKKKLGVTTHFSEIIKLQFGKKFHTLLCILDVFAISVPEFSFWIPIVMPRCAFPA